MLRTCLLQAHDGVERHLSRGDLRVLLGATDTLRVQPPVQCAHAGKLEVHGRRAGDLLDGRLLELHVEVHHRRVLHDSAHRVLAAVQESVDQRLRDLPRRRFDGEVHGSLVQTGDVFLYDFGAGFGGSGRLLQGADRRADL